MLKTIECFLPLSQRINALLLQKERVLCAVDGGCASGKTTLAAELQSHYGCNIFSMDDFFLQPFQRTAKRLAEPGGNVDYERFGAEVLRPLKNGRAFSYRPYDCGTQTLADEVSVQPNALNIVEGSYSLHPFLSDAYDLKIFLEINGEEQRRRLRQRSAKLYDRFINEWIPMENAYLNAFQIPAKCEMVFKI